MTNVAATLRRIDAVNSTDPNRLHGEPLAYVQGRAATRWLHALQREPSEVLQLVVRAHHLRRWELARADYPAGRQGYLRWRRENKAHQADSLAAILTDHRWDVATIERARELLGRTKLRTDAGTQTLEDAACLVFLETQFEAMTETTDRSRLVSIVAKTLKKMSPAAIALAGSIDLPPAAASVLADAAQPVAVA